jgi:hypothetical protein
VADPRLDELWSDVLGHWSEDGRHQAFIEHCRVTGQLREAARCYGDVAKQHAPYRDDAGREEVARKRLRAIAAIAMVDLESSTRERTARLEVLRGRKMAFRWIFLALILAGVAAIAVRRFG